MDKTKPWTHRLTPVHLAVKEDNFDVLEVLKESNLGELTVFGPDLDITK